MAKKKRPFLMNGDYALILVKIERQRPLSEQFDFTGSRIRAHGNVVHGEKFEATMTAGDETLFAVKQIGVSGWKWAHGPGKRNRWIRELRKK